MTILQAIILGIVQGLTEFLPISSSGHLLLFENIFSLNCDFLFYSVALHIGTLASVLVYYRKKIFELIKKPFCPLAKKLYLSTFITVVFVIIFEKYITNSFGNYFFVIGFGITALLLTLSSIIIKRNKNAKHLSYLSCSIVGLSQAVATLPGISRSGTTLCTSLLLGNNKEESIDYCFLLSIPIIIASLIYEFIKGGTYEGLNIYLIIIGGVFAFLSGLIAIKFMIKCMKKSSLFPFAIYLFILVLAICIFAL